MICVIKMIIMKSNDLSTYNKNNVNKKLSEPEFTGFQPKADEPLAQ
jgi:hypothetical protein